MAQLPLISLCVCAGVLLRASTSATSTFPLHMGQLSGCVIRSSLVRTHFLLEHTYCYCMCLWFSRLCQPVKLLQVATQCLLAFLQQHATLRKLWCISRFVLLLLLVLLLQVEGMLLTDGIT